MTEMCKKASLVFLSGLNVRSALLSHFTGQNHIVFAFRQHELVHTCFSMSEHKCKASAQAPSQNLDFLCCPSEI